MLHDRFGYAVSHVHASQCNQQIGISTKTSVLTFAIAYHSLLAAFTVLFSLVSCEYVRELFAAMTTEFLQQRITLIPELFETMRRLGFETLQ
jgi:hypothetical protein